jgi:hypothetical protein
MTWEVVADIIIGLAAVITLWQLLVKYRPYLA